MSVKEITNSPRYIGASTDSKPTSVRVGSLYFEYDTDLMYITYDGIHWAVYTTINL